MRFARAAASARTVLAGALYHDLQRVRIVLGLCPFCFAVLAVVASALAAAESWASPFSREPLCS